jgi:hypothetical protein
LDNDNAATLKNVSTWQGRWHLAHYSTIELGRATDNVNVIERTHLPQNCIFSHKFHTNLHLLSLRVEQSKIAQGPSEINVLENPNEAESLQLSAKEISSHPTYKDSGDDYDSASQSFETASRCSDRPFDSTCGLSWMLGILYK